ncbi:hypothetical protein [Alteraurantiacibacter buctensis]|uniref:Uncharacterized protein n=1 Tax=Alteraurantiacibacter buctensis TaxID=1503981 RepID=A0A844YXQ1_9SPHN|nr:hypothetical protein [Alteraurantiacibacter buctensis]MXO71768.1 hypothetical protein [Alteraurantiacibacter buctensis]
MDKAIQFLANLFHVVRPLTAFAGKFLDSRRISYYEQNRNTSYLRIRPMQNPTLLDWIENHLKERGISATRFGRLAVGDPRFVLDLRNGRSPRRKTIARLETYLAGLGESADPVAAAKAPASLPPCATGLSKTRNGDSIPGGIALNSRMAGQVARGAKAALQAGGEGERA